MKHINIMHYRPRHDFLLGPPLVKKAVYVRRTSDACHFDRTWVTPSSSKHSHYRKVRQESNNLLLTSVHDTAHMTTIGSGWIGRSQKGLSQSSMGGRP